MRVYLQTMRKNIVLTISTFILLIFSAWFWYGIPLFGLSDYFFDTNIPNLIQFGLVCLTVSFCFSLFFIPFHLVFAKEYARSKQRSIFKVLLITQSSLILVVAMIFAMFYLFVSFILF